MTSMTKEELKAAAQLDHMPTDLTQECRLAMSHEGPRAYTWTDKPHRLVYDLCREVERLNELVVMAYNRLECADCVKCVMIAKSYLHEAINPTEEE